MTYQIFQLPKQVLVSGAAIKPSWKVHFYLTGTTTPAAVYTTSALSVAHTQPVQADSGGVLATVYLDPSITYKASVYDQNDVLQYTVDPVNDEILSAASIGALLWPRTTAEVNAGVTPSYYYYSSSDIDVRRYGIVPNSSGAATANTTALIDLLDPTVAGPRGRLVFPNTTGADIYYFNDAVQIRDGVHLDLCGCELNFSKTIGAGDSLKGFLHAIRDVEIANGSINVNVSGTGATNGGIAVMFGSRYGYPFASYTNGIFDKTDLTDNSLEPMGNCWLKNLIITSNNPTANSAAIVMLLGGLRGGGAENVSLVGNGNSGATAGIYYEFGFATANGFPATAAGFPQWSSSHATRLKFSNVTAKNLKSNGSTDAQTVCLVEAYNCIAENIHSENCYGTFQFRVGEAHFYRPWTADGLNAKRSITLRNITSVGAVGQGIILNASQDVTGGYLADANMALAGLANLTPSQKVDLMSFSLDGFSVDGVVGVSVDGLAQISNGSTRCTGAGGNGIFIAAECRSADFNQIRALDSGSVGFRCDSAATLFPGRRKRITVRNSIIAGSAASVGMSLDNVESGYIGNCQIGYNSAFDPANEATQTIGVSLSSNCFNVVAEGNHVTTSGGSNAYNSSGSGDRGNEIRHARGTLTYTSGGFMIDGVSEATSGQIVDKTSAINTVNKYRYKKCWDNSNNFMLWATGETDVSTWKIVDNSATYTPV